MQEVKVGPSQFARLELTEPRAGANSGTLVDFKGADDKRLAALLLGKKISEKSGSSQPAQAAAFPPAAMSWRQDGAKRLPRFRYSR